jgi:ribosome-binding factor A
LSQRIEKVQKLAKEILGETIQELKDPRIGFATVTAVRMTSDLRYARVFVSVFGDEDERRTTMEGLASATPFLRAEMGRQMRLKYLPELAFELDTGADDAERLESIIKLIHEQEEGGENR